MRPKSSWLLATTLLCWLLFLLALATPSIAAANSWTFGLLPLLLFAAVVSSLASVILLVHGLSTRDEPADTALNRGTARMLSLLLVACLVTSTTTAVKSLSIDPSYTKFAFENVASGTLFAAIVLTFVLSAFQKNIYWLRLAKTTRLDERQIHERQVVFETSYKIATFVVLIAGLWLAAHISDLSGIMPHHIVNPATGHVRFPFYNLIVTLFALPLVVAAWRKR